MKPYLLLSPPITPNPFSLNISLHASVDVIFDLHIPRLQYCLQTSVKAKEFRFQSLVEKFPLHQEAGSEDRFLIRF